MTVSVGGGVVGNILALYADSDYVTIVNIC